MHKTRIGSLALLALSISLVFGACERSSTPTSPVVTVDPADTHTRYDSNPQLTAVTSVPQLRSYPGTKVEGEVAVCKDASSPAGSYTYNISAANTHAGDLVATTVTISPGQCSIVYNRVARAYGVSPFSDITITESIPSNATYRLDRVISDEDFKGPATRTLATITVRANSHHGAYADYFNVANDVTPPSPLINLGGAGVAGIIAGSTVTCVTLGTVNGDIIVSPGTAVTGFGPCVLTGTEHLNDGPAIHAQSDLTNAYNALAALSCSSSNVISADLGGTTKAAGVYCSESSIGVTGTLTLDGGGDPNANFVFQAGSTLTTAGSVVLINGAQAKNVYWLVGSSATLGTSSHWQGNIIALTSITLTDNVTLIGRALARNGAVTLGTGNVITLP